MTHHGSWAAAGEAADAGGHAPKGKTRHRTTPRLAPQGNSRLGTERYLVSLRHALCEHGSGDSRPTRGGARVGQCSMHASTLTSTSVKHEDTSLMQDAVAAGSMRRFLPRLEPNKDCGVAATSSAEWTTQACVTMPRCRLALRCCERCARRLDPDHV